MVSVASSINSRIDRLATDAREIATKLSIQKFDIYGSTIDETGVEVDQGEPKQANASVRSSVTVRVWNEQGTVGITSTTDSDRNGLELALKTAYEASFFGVKENVPDFSPEATASIVDRPNIKSPHASAATLIEQLIAVEQKLLAAHPAISGVPYNGLSQSDSDRFYLNSDGAVRSEGHSYSSIYLYSKTEEEGRKPRSAGAYRVSPSLADLDIQGCLNEAAEKTISHLNYEPIKSGKYRVVFSPEAFLSLVRVFSSLFNAQSILDKLSLSTPESIGSSIASPLLSVCDDPLHPDNVGASLFDSEGTPTRRVDLIEDGILTNFLHSSVTAKRLNAQPTGNGNIGAKVTVSPHFFHVFSSNSNGSDRSEEFNLETAENVILIDGLQALHAGVQPSQGAYSLPFDGWLVNKGKLTSIDSATVAGDFRDLLKSIVYVEPTAKVTPSGICPRIWVEELAITGE